MFNTVRSTAFSQLILCVVAIATALVLEVFLKLTPCPLCILQRVTVMAIALLALLMCFISHRHTMVYVLNTLLLIFIVCGVLLALRHLYLQSLPPDQMVSCGPGLDYLLKAFPPIDVLRLILKGSGECAKVSWRALGLSLPGWTLMLYALLLLLSARVSQLLKHKSKVS